MTRGRRYTDQRGSGRPAGERQFRLDRASGWGIGLYRDTRRSRLGGVCSGIAEYWNVEPWLVRLLWIAGILFTGTLALWAYLAAWILLVPRPQRASRSRWEAEGDGDEPPVDMEYDEFQHVYRPRRAFRYSDSSTVRLRRARERLDAALRRVEAMESYVTSRRFELDREISRL